MVTGTVRYAARPRETRGRRPHHGLDRITSQTRRGRPAAVRQGKIRRRPAAARNVRGGVRAQPARPCPHPVDRCQGGTPSARNPAIASSTRKSGSDEPDSAPPGQPSSPVPATPPGQSSPSAPHRSFISSSSSSLSPSITTEQRFSNYPISPNFRGQFSLTPATPIREASQVRMTRYLVLAVSN